MNSVYISICTNELQGVVVSNGQVIAIHSVVNTPDYLNISEISRNIRTLIMSLEQQAEMQITCVHVYLHASLPHQTHITNTPTKLNGEITIGTYNTCQINQYSYDVNVDIHNQLQHTYIQTSISKYIYDYLHTIFDSSYINVKHIFFLPLELIKKYSTNTAIVFLYDGQVYMQFNYKNAIKCEILKINFKAQGSLHFTFESSAECFELRKHINHIIHFITNHLQKYDESFNIYFTGDFANIPDLIPYVNFYIHKNNFQHTYKWLEYPQYLQNMFNTNILYYAALINTVINVI